MMTNCKKMTTLLLALAVIFGMASVSFADKEPIENVPASINPLYVRPGTGDTLKDPDETIREEEPEYDLSDQAKMMQPRVSDLTRQFPSTAFLTESFETSVPPAGWGSLVTNVNDPTATWHQAASAYDGLASAQVLYDGVLVAPQDEWMYTPALDFSAATADLKLNFAWLMSYYWGVDPYDNYDLEVWISTDGGATYPTKLWDESGEGVFSTWVWYEESISLAAYVGQSNVKIGFRYLGQDGAQANVDFVSIEDNPPPLGRCCYGDPLAPTCAMLTMSACDALGGDWDISLDCSTPCPVAGVGDDCNNPIPVTVPPLASLPYTLANQTNCGHSNSYSNTCLGSYDGGEDVMFEVTISQTGSYNITLDPKGSIWSGMLIDASCPPNATTCLGVVSSSTGTPKMIAGLTLAAGTYYIMVDTWPTPDCIPDFDITFEEAPPASDCGNPTLVTVPSMASLPYTVAGQTTCGLLDTYNNTCLGYYDGGEDHIYEVTITEGGVYQITLDPKGTTYSGMLIDATCPPNATTCLGVVSSSSGSPKSINGLTLSPGTYYIMVDTWPSPTCIPSYDIIFNEAPLPPPNDQCANATPVGEVTNLPWSTEAAGHDEAGTCLTSPNIWYVYTPTMTGNAIISLCGSSFDTRMAVYDGYSCTPLPTLIECNDDACGLQSEVLTPVIAGQQYLIEVGGYSANVGTGVLTISVCTPPYNDNCENANIQTTFPAVITGDNTCSSNQCTSFPGNHVWEAFTLTADANVTISYQGTTPAFENAWLNLALDCPCTGLADGFTYAGSYTFAPDGNVVINWACLKPGTYYYPVLEEPGASGPYQLTISASFYATGCYCPAQSNSAAYEYISRVELVDIDNSSGASNYTDYTALQTTLYIGRTYQATVEVGSGYSTDEGWLFIDWNNDFDFDDAGETIAMAGSPGAGPYTATLVPPVGSVEAPTRMRVRMFDGYYNAPTPCGNTSYGEVEDYTLVLDSYVCGDANGDGVLDMNDVLYLIGYMFQYGPAPVPYFAGDCTGDDIVNINDVVYLAGYLFHGGNPPVCPF
ncbi:MAG: GEVED domain-containing protein [candidate division Zixibacteria bacterium]|jgi:hypothetical protein|nr:GEVED domain-containing protein [candidate division Zixibacteria bacterium]